MTLDLMQKVAKSGCINKSNYLIGKMMAARQKKGAIATKPIIGKVGREQSFVYDELDGQETEFYLLSKAMTILSFKPTISTYLHAFKKGPLLFRIYIAT